MRVGDFATKLGVQYREVRYLLEQGILPHGVDESPGKGEHRDLDAAQAFWLAIVLKLKAVGIRAPIAGEIADFARKALQGVTQNLNWEHSFHPFRGRLQTDNEWYLELADMVAMRLVTSANPSDQGLYSSPWWRLGKQSIDNLHPIVVIRVDLASVARLLSE